MKKILMVIICTMTSCSMINNDSRGHYKGASFRHGVVPVEMKLDNKVSTVPVDDKAAGRGKVLYQKNCLECHGRDGRGDGPKGRGLDPAPRDLTEISQEVPSFKFYMSVSRYKGEMPGWKNVFSKRDLYDLENYIRSLSKK